MITKIYYQNHCYNYEVELLFLYLQSSDLTNSFSQIAGKLLYIGNSSFWQIKI